MRILLMWTLRITGDNEWAHSRITNNIQATRSYMFKQLRSLFVWHTAHTAKMVQASVSSPIYHEQYQQTRTLYTWTLTVTGFNECLHSQNFQQRSNPQQAEPMHHTHSAANDHREWDSALLIWSYEWVTGCICNRQQ